MNDNLFDFLHERVQSFIQWDLVRFFHDNPHTKETAENLARYTGRDVKTIAHELEGLVETEVLIVEEIGDLEIYGLAPDQSMRQMLHRFIEACHDRQFRVQAIQQVIQQMQYASSRHDY